MLPFLWLLAILATLAAASCAAAGAIASFRARHMPLALLSIFALITLVGVAIIVRLPIFMLLSAAIIAPLCLSLVRRMSNSNAQAGQTLKLSTAHLFLVLGSIMFLVPFAWLISTSLKTDDEMSAFPPIWIPSQQIATQKLQNAEGRPAPLSHVMRQGQQVLVAEVAELPSGSVRVRPVPASYTAGDFTTASTRPAAEGAPTISALARAAQPGDFEVEREKLTKIRQTAPRWENYAEALEFLPPETHYGLTFLGNTLFLTLMSAIGTVLSSSLVAYSFARLKWPGRQFLFWMLLATMMIPGAVTMMPQFLIFRSLGWIDTLRPLWVPAFFGSAFNIFLLRQFFLSIPNELEDAAKIDGCGPFGTYWSIMLPQVKPALAAIAIMAILGSWNNFMGPLIYLSSPEKMPLAYALQLYGQQHGGEPGLLMAASTLMVLPIIVLFFFTQRYFIEGVSLSGLGGR